MWKRSRSGAESRPARVVAPDQRERAQRHVDRPRVDPLAQQNVDAKILHRRIEEFFDRLGQPMNLVDEQDRAFLGVGQVGNQVLGGLQHRAAGDLKGRRPDRGDAGGERGLAQARRAVEQDVPQRVAPLAGRIDRDLQPAQTSRWPTMSRMCCGRKARSSWGGYSCGAEGYFKSASPYLRRMLSKASSSGIPSSPTCMSATASRMASKSADCLSVPCSRVR